MTTADVQHRMEFSVEVPGTPEQVWDAIATAKGLSAWFTPTFDREGPALYFDMGPEGGSEARVTGWEPPHRLVYEEDWAALAGHPDANVTPIVSEFVVEATSGGTCVVRVVSSAYGTGAEWENEFWEMMSGWQDMFENLRVYLANFPGQAASTMRLGRQVDATPEDAWRAIQRETAVHEVGKPVEVHGLSGVVERIQERQAIVRTTAPVEGMMMLYAWDMDSSTRVGLSGYFFSENAPEWVAREQDGWQRWLDGVVAPGR